MLFDTIDEQNRERPARLSEVLPDPSNAAFLLDMKTVATGRSEARPSPTALFEDGAPAGEGCPWQPVVSHATLPLVSAADARLRYGRVPDHPLEAWRRHFERQSTRPSAHQALCLTKPVNAA
jgi:hypothetical protein